MAVYGLCDGWFGNDDWPLRPADLPSNAALERLWADTEQDVFLSAFDPGAGEYRPPQLPRAPTHYRTDEQVIFEHAWKD